MQGQDLIAVRIKDGIFAGNVTAAEDRDFLGMNKITHVINCAGAEVADYFVGDPELKYLSFPWKDTTGSVCTTVLFDSNGENIKRATAFIDEALEEGDCVLVHSFFGVSRAPVLIAAYLIYKYGWKLDSALSFIEMAHPDVSIKPHFLRQLRLFAKKHDVDYDVFDGNVDDSVFGLDNDQWMLRNTLLNGLAFEEQQANALYHQCTKKVDLGAPKVTASKRARGRITFIDTNKGTGVDSLTTVPVTDVKPVRYVDPTVSNNDMPSFVGSQGPVALSSGRRSPSIMSRSVSPCTRHLVSDDHDDPKGRQQLRLVKKPADPEPKEEQEPQAQTAPTPRSRPATPRTSRSQAQPEEPGATAPTSAAAPLRSGRESTPVDYHRLAPPTPKSAQVRSPYAALGSSHKYRNGSPLPLNQGKKKKKSLSRTNSSQDEIGRVTKPKTSTAVKRSSSNNSRISSTATPPPASPRPDAAPVRSRSGDYKGIAPSRSAAAVASRPAWNAPPRPSSASTEDAPGTVRRSGSSKPKLARSSSSGSVGNRSSSTKGRSSSATGKRKSSADGRVSKSKASASTSSTGSGAVGDSAGSGGGVVRRQVPSAISSHRK